MKTTLKLTLLFLFVSVCFGFGSSVWGQAEDWDNVPEEQFDDDNWDIAPAEPAPMDRGDDQSWSPEHRPRGRGNWNQNQPRGPGRGPSMGRGREPGRGPGMGRGRGMGRGGDRRGRDRITPNELRDFLREYVPKLAQSLQEMRDRNPQKFRQRVEMLTRLYAPAIHQMEYDPA